MTGKIRRMVAVAMVVVGALSAAGQGTRLEPGKMARMGTVDERFQSYNVEMLEVTGGKFWKPYRSQQTAPAKTDAAVPAGMDPNAYEYRAPLDLSNARLRKLAAALGPAYVRVSGTWANTTYFDDGSGAAVKTPPAGFGGVLTRDEWKGVIDFAKATNAEIVTSFAFSPGTRDESGAWTPKEANKFLEATRAMGGRIAAAEFMNEPTAASMGGAPKGYDVAAYGRDIAVFRPYLKKASPQTIFLGPGGVGEGGAMPLPAAMGPILSTQALLEATGPVFDVLSYHYYGGVSSRCAAMARTALTTEAAARTDAWLSKTGTAEQFYAGLRDRYLPGKQMWVTETGETACGGNKWASTFVDTFRYLNQLGVLAQRGVQVVMHNTLDASDYALLDERDFHPRPNYWAALLWRRMMGTTVLQPGALPAVDVHLYAHCLQGVSGGVAVLAINAGDSAASLELPMAATEYVLSARDMDSGDVELNGVALKLGAKDSLPALKGVDARAGAIKLAPGTITFLGVATANNAACKL